MNKDLKNTAIVIASEEQLKKIAINDIPTGALVEVYEINEHDTGYYGLGSKIRYKYEKFDYIIPNTWLKFL